MKHWVRVVLEDAVSENPTIGKNVRQGLKRIIAILEAHEDHQFRTDELEGIAQAIVDCSTLDELAQLIRHTTTTLGFQDFVLFVAKQGGSSPFASRICTSWNAAWVSHYTNKSYQHVDPVMSRAFSEDGLFLHSDLGCEAPAIQSFWQDAAGHGVGCNGICYVATIRNGARLGISYSTACTEKETKELARLNSVDLVEISRLVFYRFSDLACLTQASEKTLSYAELRYLHILATSPNPECVFSVKSTLGSSAPLEAAIRSKLKVETILQAVAIASSKHWFDRLPYDFGEFISPIGFVDGMDAPY